MTPAPTFQDLFWRAVERAKKSRELSVDGVAQKLGISRQAIYEVAKRPRVVGLATVDKIIELAGLNEEDRYELRLEWFKDRVRSGNFGVIFDVLIDALDQLPTSKKRKTLEKAIETYREQLKS